MSEGKTRLVVDIGHGRFCVVTTTFKVVSAATLAQMGLSPPGVHAPESDAPDLPWSAEPSARFVTGAERAEALQYWNDTLGGYEPRLQAQIAGFLREFGLHGVKQAISQVAATNPKGGAVATYQQVVRVFREMRERKQGPGP